MSDRYKVQLQIGGELPRSQLTGLVEALQADGWGVNWDDGAEDELLEELTLPDSRLPSFTQSEVSLQSLDESIRFCVDNKLGYILRVSGNEIYGGHIQWRTAEMTEEKCITADHDAWYSVVDAQTLECFQTKGLTLDEVITTLKNSPPTLPEFKIV